MDMEQIKMAGVRAMEDAVIASIPKSLTTNDTDKPEVTRAVEHLAGLNTNANKIPKPPARKTAIQQAQDVIYGDREKTYGDPGKNLRVIAEYWSVHLSATKHKNIRLTTDDVCVMMILLKQARQANTPGHPDSVVDTIGYAALQDRVNNPEPIPVVDEVLSSGSPVVGGTL